MKHAHLHVTDAFHHCYGCGKTVGVHEFVLCDSNSLEVIACKECNRRLI